MARFADAVEAPAPVSKEAGTPAPASPTRSPYEQTRAPRKDRPRTAGSAWPWAPFLSTPDGSRTPWWAQAKREADETGKSGCRCGAPGGAVCERCARVLASATGRDLAAPGLLVASAAAPAEREADRVASQIEAGKDVMAAAQPRTREAEANADHTAAPAALSARVERLRRGGGVPLPPEVRAFYEARLGVDLGDVRVHAGAEPADLAQDLNASAFTIGRDVVFGRNQLAPATRQGRFLLAHELAHVVQHGRASGFVPPEVVHRAPPGPAPPSGMPPHLVDAGLGEMIALQSLDRQGLYIFHDWAKDVSGNGFDFLAYDPQTKRTWFVDNKAYSGTIDEASSFKVGTYERNVESAKKFLTSNTASAEARAALEAIEKNAVEKVVSNAFSKGNAGFSEKLFASGIKVFDIRLGRLFSGRAAWLAELREAGLLAGARRFAQPGRILGRQRGFATVGGLLFLLVAVGTTLYAIRHEENKPLAVVKIAAEFAIAGLIFRAVGNVGVIALSVLSMCSDDYKMQQECDREDAVKDFMRKNFPSAVTPPKGWFSFEDFDPVIFDEVYNLLFNTDPIVLPETATQNGPVPPPGPSGARGASGSIGTDGAGGAGGTGGAGGAGGGGGGSRGGEGGTL